MPPRPSGARSAEYPSGTRVKRRRCNAPTAEHGPPRSTDQLVLSAASSTDRKQSRQEQIASAEAARTVSSAIPTKLRGGHELGGTALSLRVQKMHVFIACKGE